jgi:hypothetical protein
MWCSHIFKSAFSTCMVVWSDDLAARSFVAATSLHNQADEQFRKRHRYLGQIDRLNSVLKVEITLPQMYTSCYDTLCESTLR